MAPDTTTAGYAGQGSSRRRRTRPAPTVAGEQATERPARFTREENGLTPRQREVAALIGQGHGNREIAEALVLRGITDQVTAPRQASVLIVEDDPGICSALADLLWCQGYRVLQTASGTSGVRLARRHQPDVLLLDLTLPGKPGLEVLQDLKARADTCTTPVIVMSGSAWLLLPQETRRIFGVIQKPFDAEEVLAHLDAAVANTRRARRA